MMGFQESVEQRLDEMIELQRRQTRALELHVLVMTRKDFSGSDMDAVIENGLLAIIADHKKDDAQ